MIQLHLGPRTIEALLPHREPLRLVETIEGFAPGRSPRLRATLPLTGQEPVLAGHFPERPVWPGVYVIEGLAQCGGLLMALTAIHEHGGAEALARLGDPAPRMPIPPRRDGALARAQVDLLRPVVPPATLRYEVRYVGAFGSLHKIDGHASAGDHAVAQGSVSIALFGED